MQRLHRRRRDPHAGVHGGQGGRKACRAHLRAAEADHGLVFPVIDMLWAEVPTPENSRKPKVIPLNANFEKKEFQELWSRINQKAVYQVEFDSDELIGKCVVELDAQLKVSAMQYVVQTGIQKTALEAADVASGSGFKVDEHPNGDRDASTAASQVKYDLLGEIAEKTQLTRRTVAEDPHQGEADDFRQVPAEPGAVHH